MGDPQILGNDGLKSRYVKICQEDLIGMLPPIEFIDTCFIVILMYTSIYICTCPLFWQEPFQDKL